MSKIANYIDSSFSDVKFNNQKIRNSFMTEANRASYFIDICEIGIITVRNQPNKILDAIILDDCLENVRWNLNNMRIDIFLDTSSVYPTNLYNLEMELMKWRSVYRGLHVSPLAHARDNNTIIY